MKYLPFLIFFLAMLSCTKNKNGCTNPLALNYNATAKFDDGSCKEKSPILEILSIDSINGTVARVKVELDNPGKLTIQEKGVCWGSQPFPRRNSNEKFRSNKSEASIFACNITSLTKDRKYYVRAYAVINDSVYYGNELTFYTLEANFPIVGTLTIDEINQNSAIGSCYVYYPYPSYVNEKGICWGISLNPTVSDNKCTNELNVSSFSCELTDLTGNSIYYARAYAKNSRGITYSENVSFKTTGTSLSIGDYLDGGVVVYIDDAGHGLIMSRSDIFAETQWGCLGIEISGADSESIGSGRLNTADILADCPESSIAAEICDELVLFGKSDWFLPSYEEIELIYENKELIESVCIENGGTAMSIAFYWTSSETSSTTAKVAYFNNDFGIVSSSYDKDTELRVRAFRSF